MPSMTMTRRTEYHGLTLEDDVDDHMPSFLRTLAMMNYDVWCFQMNRGGVGLDLVVVDLVGVD